MDSAIEKLRASAEDAGRKDAAKDSDVNSILYSLAL